MDSYSLLDNWHLTFLFFVGGGMEMICLAFIILEEFTFSWNKGKVFFIN